MSIYVLSVKYEGIIGVFSSYELAAEEMNSIHNNGWDMVIQEYILDRSGY